MSARRRTGALPSQSVTSIDRFWLQMLQIDTFPDDAVPLSQSVTSRSNFAELLLQIETNQNRPAENLNL